MVLRRERGQERPEKRTVGNRESTKRPRISKNESKGEEKNYGSGRTGASINGPRIGKSRSSKFEVKDAKVGRETRTVKKISTRSAAKPRTGVVRPGGKEKTSDIFRRNVIQRKVVKETRKS